MACSVEKKNNNGYVTASKCTFVVEIRGTFRANSNGWQAEMKPGFGMVVQNFLARNFDELELIWLKEVVGL